jgi:serine/threonine protein kinase
VVGWGGLGTVYEAVRADEMYRKRVAIKVVRREMATQMVVRRFQHERQILAELNHPNIAGLLDGGVTADGRPYFAMEYVEGRPIDEYCRERALGIEERIALFLQACDAVQYAHRSLVVHRDLKPTNILVTEQGVPKLLDFGIARAEVDARLTSDGRALGTPDYMSPEQVLGGTIDARTDVWGAGVLLYELVSGELPFAGPDLMGVLKRVLESPPSFPRGARGLDGPLWKILTAAIRKRPNERTASARVMRDQLVSWLASASDVASAAPAGREPTAESREMETASLPITPSMGVGLVGAMSYEDPVDHASMDALVKKKLGG